MKTRYVYHLKYKYPYGGKHVEVHLERGFVRPLGLTADFQALYDYLAFTHGVESAQIVLDSYQLRRIDEYTDSGSIVRSKIPTIGAEYYVHEYS